VQLAHTDEPRLAVVPTLVKRHGMPAAENLCRIGDIDATLLERLRPFGSIKDDTHALP